MTRTQTTRLLYNLTLDLAWELQPQPAGLHMLMKTSCFVPFCLGVLLLVVVCLFSLKRDTETHSFCYDTTGFCCIRTSYSFYPFQEPQLQCRPARKPSNSFSPFGHEPRFERLKLQPGLGFFVGSGTSAGKGVPGMDPPELPGCLVLAHGVSSPGWAGALLDHSTHRCHHTGLSSDTSPILGYFC